MYIYKITNKINGKIYIGQTTQDPLARFRQHCGGRHQLIDKVIKRYGSSNFDFEIIKRCSSLEELDNSELEYIYLYNSKIPNGYNIKTTSQRIRSNYSDNSYLPNSNIVLSGINKLLKTPYFMELDFEESHKRLIRADKRKKQIIISNNNIEESVNRIKENYKKSGLLPYGFSEFQNKIIVNENEHRVIKFIKKKYIEGYTYTEIAKMLDTDLYPTKNGGKWRSSTVSRILNTLPITIKEYKELVRLKDIKIDIENELNISVGKIKIIRFLRLIGLTSREIAREMNDMEIPSANGSPWTEYIINKVLNRYKISGSIIEEGRFLLVKLMDDLL